MKFIPQKSTSWKQELHLHVLGDLPDRRLGHCNPFPGQWTLQDN